MPASAALLEGMRTIKKIFPLCSFTVEIRTSDISNTSPSTATFILANQAVTDIADLKVLY